jgi:hypothetical protein
LILLPQYFFVDFAITRMLRRLSDADDFLGSKVTMLLKNIVVLESNCTEKTTFVARIWQKMMMKEQANTITLITHGFRVSVVSDLRERVRNFRITFALCVKKIFISWVCYCVTYTPNVFTNASNGFFFDSMFSHVC